MTKHVSLWHAAAYCLVVVVAGAKPLQKELIGLNQYRTLNIIKMSSTSDLIFHNLTIYLRSGKPTSINLSLIFEEPTHTCENGFASKQVHLKD